MLPAANVTPRQRRSASGGALRLAAVVALLALCLARTDAAASLAGRTPVSEKRAASALENARGQVELGHYTTLPAVTAEGQDDGPVVPERELEMIEDYTPTGPNNKHEPRHP